MKVRVDSHMKSTVRIYPFGDEGINGYFAVKFAGMDYDTGRYVKNEPPKIGTNMSLGQELTLDDTQKIIDALTIAVCMVENKPSITWNDETYQAWAEARRHADYLTATKEATQ